jgi:hypothetical protein
MIEPWDLSAQRAAASRERAEAVHALLVRFAAWLRSAFASAPTIRAPLVKERACFGTEC